MSEKTPITRRRFLEVGAAVLAGSAVAGAAAGEPGRASTSGGVMSFDEYRRFDALDLAELVRAREVTPTELLDVALARQRQVEPSINAVSVPLEKRARIQIDAGLAQGPFRGVPFLLKDLGSYLEGTTTTNGSKLYQGRQDGESAEIVRRFLDAGLVVFGKTASPEFGLSPSTESALHGATRNPWNLDYSSGGSSGGSAAAVAAGILPIAHASDGGGSIRIPASCCALFGMKPSRYRTPIGPPARGDSWAGLSCHHAVSRSVRDSAALLDAISGPVGGSSFLAPPPKRRFIQEVGASPGKLRIALVERAFSGAEVDPEVTRAAAEAGKLCESLGHIVEPASPPIDFGAVAQAVSLVIIPANIAMQLADRAAELGRPLQESDVEPTTFGIYQMGKRISAADYERARGVLFRASRVMAEFQHERDVLLSPVLGSPPLPIGILTLDDPEGFGEAATRYVPFTMLFNATGQPSMSVPLHWTKGGLPVGVMFSGRYGDEATLFRLAGQLEAARPWANRFPPLA